MFTVRILVPAKHGERNMLGTLTGQFDGVDAGTLATLRPILANV